MCSIPLSHDNVADVPEFTQQIVELALSDDDANLPILGKSVSDLANTVGQIDLKKVDLSHVPYPHFLEAGALVPNEKAGVSRIVFDPNFPPIVARGDRTAHVLEVLQGVFNAAHAYRVLRLPEWVQMVRIRKQESVHFRPLKVNREYLQVVCLSEVAVAVGDFRGTLYWLYLQGTKLMTAGRIQFWAGRSHECRSLRLISEPQEGE